MNQTSLHHSGLVIFCLVHSQASLILKPPFFGNHKKTPISLNASIHDIFQSTIWIYSYRKEQFSNIDDIKVADLWSQISFLNNISSILLTNTPPGSHFTILFLKFYSANFKDNDSRRIFIAFKNNYVLKTIVLFFRTVGTLPLSQPYPGVSWLKLFEVLNWKSEKKVKKIETMARKWVFKVTLSPSVLLKFNSDDTGTAWYICRMLSSY